MTSAFDNLHVIIGTGAVVIVAGAALAFGSARLRLVGLLQVTEMICSTLLDAGASPDDRLLLMDVKSFVVLVVYGVMCFRWPDRWVVLLTGLQGFAVLIHLSDLLDLSLPRSVNGLFLNVTGWGMLLVIATATAIHIMNRFDRPDTRS
ncbi:hypothetical protein [Brevundimonas sp.]|uniref:hypothetical protein n=1 Tax=Brevundimonas sp. TaxID=1871086 RepID=UPI00260C9762|nr:hypothetical protein [Brevundimonas sp.]